MIFYNYIKENILVPRNLDGRKEKLIKQNIKLLSQEVIEGDLTIDETFDGINDELVKVKEINGGVDINLSYIPSWLKNVKINGYFNCGYNNLKSLKNSPQYINGDFWCNDNKLTSLEGCPKYIGGNLICSDNLKTLKLPKGIEVNGRFIN